MNFIKAQSLPGLMGYAFKNHIENHNDDSNDVDGETITESRVTYPRLYQVLMHNDDYTTMDFVIHVLQKFFHKNPTDAHDIMMKVHHDGLAVCGIYTKEIAEAKVLKVNKYSTSHGHPLKCSYEPCQE